MNLPLLAADLLLILHTLVAAFIVLGLVLILVGGLAGWAWVRSPVFRWLHVAAIAVVVVQAWLGRICPLTRWEMALRARAGQGGYDGSFIAHWLGELLYYQAPPWVFAVVYTLFGALVALAWLWLPPIHRRRGRLNS